MKLTTKQAARKHASVEFICPACKGIKTFQDRARHWCDCNPKAEFEMSTVEGIKGTEQVLKRFGIR